MKEIIEEISQIDAVAYENEQKNKLILSKEKQRFESIMKNYRDQTLDTANKEAKNIYRQIVSKAQIEQQMQEERIKELSSQIKSNYIKVEKDIIKEVLEKLSITDAT